MRRPMPGTRDRRKDAEDLEATMQALRAARDYDQPVTLTPRQASLIILWGRVHKILPHWF